MKKILLFLYLFVCAGLFAQTTSITGTIQDPLGQSFGNGTCSLQFVPTPNTPGPFTVNGAAVPTQPACAIDSNGLISGTVTDNAFITPTGSAWLLTVCPNAAVPCTAMTLQITGASMDVSAQINNQIPIIKLPPLAATPRAYQDSEVTPLNMGSTYFNVSTKTMKTWDGTQWITTNSYTLPAASAGALGGVFAFNCNTLGSSYVVQSINTNGTETCIPVNVISGTTNYIVKYTGTTTQGVSSLFDDGTSPVRSPLGLNVASQFLGYEIANNNTTGTTILTAGCDDGTGKIIICPSASSVTDQPIGFVNSGAGTVGNAIVCIIGWCQVKMDGTATAKHYAIVSPTTDGYLHDAGTGLTAGQANFFIAVGCTGAGCTATVRLLIADDFNATSTAGFVRGIALGNTALHTAAIASLACDNTTATANGTLSTDRIVANTNADITAVTGYAPSLSGGLRINVFPTTNTVNIKVCNWSNASITPGAVTINWEVVR